jgi:dienelactone hydrolase
MFRALALSLLVASSLLGQTGPSLIVEPVETLIDEIVRIRASGLPPSSPIQLALSVEDPAGRIWRSEATYQTDAAGTLDARRDPAVEGYFRGVEPMGLFWTVRMDPSTPASKRNPRVFVRTPAGSHSAELTLSAGGKSLSTARIVRHFSRPDVQVREIQENNLIGRLYVPPAHERRPAIVVLTGSDGGIPLRHAPLLAARGYVVFALAYYRLPSLPSNIQEVPVDYIEKGLAWLKSLPQVDPRRIGIIGLSKGAELALLTASLNPREFRAVVGVSPSSVVWEAVVRDPAPTPYASVKHDRSSWSRKGQPLPFLPFLLLPETLRRMEQEGGADAVEFSAPALDDKAAFEKARIRVEDIRSPVLLLASKADRVWPAARMASQIEATMRKHGRSCEALIYDNAGHLISDSWLPPAYGTAPPDTGRWVRISAGGTAADTIHASMDSWPKVLAFFNKHLKPAR